MKQEIVNSELTKDVIKVTKESYHTVRGIIHQYSSFIADMMKEGAFETMHVPYFGKFEPKTRQIQRRFHNKGKHYAKRNRGTIHNNSGLDDRDQQALVNADPGV